VNSGCLTRDVSLREMILAMGHLPEGATFRWFQAAYTASDGSVHPSDTLRVTMGQARRGVGRAGQGSPADDLTAEDRRSTQILLDRIGVFDVSQAGPRELAEIVRTLCDCMIEEGLCEDELPAELLMEGP
jgi:hypothetical protein